MYLRQLLLISGLFLSLMGCSPVAASSTPSTTPPTTTSQSTIPSRQIPSPTSPTTVQATGTTLPTPTTETKPAPELSGILYLWMHRYLEPLYTSVDLATGDFPFFLENRSSPATMVVDGKVTVGLAFAPYSPSVAFLSKSDRSTDLWLADLDLTAIERLWTDDRDWLASLSDPGTGIIKWGPADSTLLISSYLSKDHLVLHSISTKRTLEVVGHCDLVAPLPDSDQLTIWCFFDEGAPAPYGYFAPDGEILFTDVTPDEQVDVFEWSFAPENKRLAYIPTQGNITIATKSGSKLELPIRLLDEPGDFRTKPFLQWSENGGRVLIYGYNQEYCPLIEEPASGKLKPRECWLVIDSNTGEIMWGPNESASGIREITGLPLEELFSPCAGLSPDSNKLALCYRSGATDYFVLVALDNNGKVTDLGSSQLLDFKWVMETEP